MKKILIFFFLLTFFSQHSFSQLNCNPQLGDKLLPSKPEITGIKVEKIKPLNIKIKEKTIEKLVVISKTERNSVRVIIYKKDFFNNDFNSFFYTFFKNKKDLENLINLIGSPEDFFEKNIFSPAFRKYAIQFHPDFEELNDSKAEYQNSNDTNFDEFSETVVDSSATDFIEKIDIENKSKNITEAEKLSSKVLDPEILKIKHFNPVTNWRINSTILSDSEVVDFFDANKTQIKKLFSDSLKNYLRLTYNPELFIYHGDTANFLNSDIKPNHTDLDDSWIITGNSNYMIDKISHINSKDCSYRLNKHALILHHLMEALNKEGEYYKAVKYYNYNSKFFSETNYLNNLKLDLSKSIILDEKFHLAFPILEILVKKFETGKIKQSNTGFIPNEIDIADLVSLYYYVCFKLSKYQTIINTQKKPQFKNIKFPEQTKLISHSYLNLRQKNLACKYLENEYLRGNEDARELMKELCK